MHHYCITFDIHFSLCKMYLFQCTGRHLRLIDMCGLFMLKIIIFKKFSAWGLYSGALNSPEITVVCVCVHVCECVHVYLWVSVCLNDCVYVWVIVNMWVWPVYQFCTHTCRLACCGECLLFIWAWESVLGACGSTMGCLAALPERIRTIIHKYSSYPCTDKGPYLLWLLYFYFSFFLPPCSHHFLPASLFLFFS